MSQSFISRTLLGFTRALAKAMASEETSAQPGLLQQLDPRVRLLGMLALVVAVILCRRWDVIAALFALAVVIAIASRVSIPLLATRVWLLVLFFTGSIAVPALFTTPGRPIITFPVQTFAISAEGLRTAILLVLRVETAVTFTSILVLCTPWVRLLRALRSFHLPVEVVSMLAMTHRYVFLLIETANQMFESRQSRTVGRLPGPEQRKMTARTAGVLLNKSIDMSQEIYLSMLSRGYRGEIRVLDEGRMRARDFAGLAAFLFVGAAAAWVGR
jgi:cobalt/nickel transport system permease protein